MILADAASTDGSYHFIAHRFPHFLLVRLQSRNAYAARNRAAAQARGRILAFTDSDCAVGTAWLRSLHDAIKDGADLVTGPVGPAPGASATLRRVHDYENTRMQTMCRVDGRGVAYAYTNNFAIRAELFRALGGFSETQGRGGDSELALRALASGSHGMAYATGMHVTHLEMDTLLRWWLKKLGFPRFRGH